ncbi:uncharacterized protein Z519_11926 [Cladophialophora bantiana CBS 173.52]|uniref:Xylanolytic transcriptional activator regulatory domain-containing protein n=1 Tax=Cladophialophora bantiana (strain ATCC 10958 / CBS 173.52 / CDC B-1940 / NIH 8579) TaxID=1442370 RepID=A0A0D2EBX9_CLAB1|nr:uncharacterized protein Z519_11926 [Cladophialophora bantiana CBS 173.52]KIW87601.1 hypothetical protein Z519_11926 [Cladophialophora bantiana CBS 173.52]
MDCPRVATLQALLILSSLEAAAGRDSRGWLYSEMTVHLVFDLGLHLDLGHEEVIPSSRKRDDGGLKFLYKSIFQAVCSSNMLWSVGTGRPASMKNLIQFISAEEVQPSSPRQNPPIDNSPTQLSSDSGQSGAEGVPVYLYRLSVEISKVMETFYSRPFALNGSPTIAKDITLSLQNWLGALPAALRIEESEKKAISSTYPSEVIELKYSFTALKQLREIVLTRGHRLVYNNTRQSSYFTALFSPLPVQRTKVRLKL